MQICRVLWDAGICADMMHRGNARIHAQLTAAATIGAYVAVIIGQREIDTGTVTIKNLVTTDQEAKQITIAREEMIGHIRTVLENEQNPTCGTTDPDTHMKRQRCDEMIDQMRDLMNRAKQEDNVERSEEIMNQLRDVMTEFEALTTEHPVGPAERLS